MGNRGILIVIVILLVAIFGVVTYQANQSPGEQIVDGFSEGIEEVGDEIDDNIDAR